MVHHVPLRVVWILQALSGLLQSHILDSGKSANMDLNPEDLTFLIIPAEAMSTIFMHMPVVFRGAPITEVHHVQMARFVVVRDEVPKVVSVFEVSPWVLLPGVNQVGKFDWILHPKNGQGISHKIPIALLSVELQPKTSRIPLSITRAYFTYSRRKSSEHGSLFSNFFEDFGLTIFGDVVGDNEHTMDSSALCMDDSLRDSLSIELGQFVDEVVVLDQKGTHLACRHRVLVVVHGHTHGGSHLLRHFPKIIINAEK